MVVQLKGVWSYNYRVYGCTTIRVVVVRLKGVATRLSRPAEPSGNLREAVSFNLRNYLFKLKETSPWTQRDVSFSQLSRYILSNKVPHSSYEYTSSSQRSRIYKPTQSNLQANAVESTSQRSHIWVPAQRYVATLWNVRTHAMKCMVSSAYFKARIYWTVFSSILLSHLPLML